MPQDDDRAITDLGASAPNERFDVGDHSRHPTGTDPSATRRTRGPSVSAEVEGVDRVALGLQHLGDARVPARMLGGTMHHDDRGPGLARRQPPPTEDVGAVGALEGELVHQLLLSVVTRPGGESFVPTP